MKDPNHRRHGGNFRPTPPLIHSEFRRPKAKHRRVRIAPPHWRRHQSLLCRAEQTYPGGADPRRHSFHQPSQNEPNSSNPRKDDPGHSKRAPCDRYEPANLHAPSQQAVSKRPPAPREQTLPHAQNPPEKQDLAQPSLALQSASRENKNTALEPPSQQSRLQRRQAKTSSIDKISYSVRSSFCVTQTTLAGFSNPAHPSCRPRINPEGQEGDEPSNFQKPGNKPPEPNRNEEPSAQIEQEARPEHLGQCHKARTVNNRIGWR